MASFQGLGPGLVELRRQSGKMQVEVAKMAGITKGMLSSYENERTAPSLTSLERILDALKMRPSDLDRAMRRARLARGEESPETTEAVRFGPVERALLADSLEGLLEVMHRVVLPVLRGSTLEPEPEREPGD